jgi:hypothetical protein
MVAIILVLLVAGCNGTMTIRYRSYEAELNDEFMTQLEEQAIEHERLDEAILGNRCPHGLRK